MLFRFGTNTENSQITRNIRISMICVLIKLKVLSQNSEEGKTHSNQWR
jgi:hypothetical protein